MTDAIEKESNTSLNLDAALGEQIAYYNARAHEYDEWFFRQGRYDRGEARKEAWFEEVGRVEAALGEAGPSGAILELACGTGLWTRRLVRSADRLFAIDASQKMLDINKARVADERVEYRMTDIFEWRPEETYDFIFFSFWLSHVPPALFASFWSRIRQALKPGGKVFFVDSLWEKESTATDHLTPDRTGVVERKLNDGSVFSVIKVFHEPGELQEMLLHEGWAGRVRTTGRFFLYGSFS